MDNLKTALDFLAVCPDARLFPAIWHADKHQHQGCIKWGSQSSNDPEKIKAWARKWPKAYFCIALAQSGMSVVDVDDKNGKSGTRELTALELDNGILPATLQARTPSGGKHYLFAGNMAKGANKLAPGVDSPVMIPVPGSVVEGKGAYTITRNNPVAALPDWCMRIAGETKKKSEDAATPAIELDQVNNVMDATAYAMSAPPSVEGDGGDDNAYRVACRIRDFGVSDDTCLSIMLRYWNHRCLPPWDRDELEDKVNHAYAYAQTQAGEGTAEADFAGVPVPASAKGGGFPAPKDWREYADTPPPRVWLIRDWLPYDETSSLYGDGGLGKSLLGLQLMRSITTGAPFLGVPVETTMPALGVFAEDSDEELHRRKHAVDNSPAYQFAEQKHDCRLWSMARQNATLASVKPDGSISRSAFASRLKQELDSMGPGPKFLILDTLADIFAGSENDRTSSNRFIKVVIGEIAHKHNCTPLILAHPSLSGIASKSQSSGSTAWNNAVRNRLTLSPHENENLSDYRVLCRIKANYAKKGAQKVILWQEGAFVHVDEADIVDEVEIANLDIVMNAICSLYEQGTPAGLHPQSKPYLRNVAIKDADGQLMGWDEKRRLVDKLIVEGALKNMTGCKRGNGLWPKSAVG